MNESTRHQIKADVQELLSQGPGAEKFYASLARLRRVSLEEVLEIAAECGPARQISAEQAAQESLRAQRAARSANSAAFREYDHLED